MTKKKNTQNQQQEFIAMQAALDGNKQRATYSIHRRYFVCFDEDNPLVRKGQMESNPIPGTMSHYCFAAISQPGRMQIRKYSCYCLCCCKKQYSTCVFVDIVRTDHPKLTPKVWNTRGCERAKNTGWIEYQMKLTDDVTRRETRSASKSVRDAFSKDLRAGSVFGVYCGGPGEVDHRHFELAEAVSKGKKMTSKVTYVATHDDANWDIKKGKDTVLNIQWLDRVNEAEDQRLFHRGLKQTIDLESVLPMTVKWESTSSGKGPNGSRKVKLMRMSEEEEEEMVQWCRIVKETSRRWQQKEPRCK
jgi:hypothetical protein